jgi:hypothetical protein
MTSHYLANAIRQLTAASKLIASQPTVYEGLYTACLGPLQRIGPNDDLLPIQRLSFLRWRSRLMHGSDRPFDTVALMTALRQLGLSEANDITHELDWLANQWRRRADCKIDRKLGRRIPQSLNSQ